MPPTVSRDDLLGLRLATQHLCGPPLPQAVDAVRLLTCVQSQDAPLAHWSLGLRTHTESYAACLAEQATSTFVRTHVLRPTWHFVAAEDLRWIQALTAAKVLSSMAGRHRGLGLDAPAVDRALTTLQELLARRTALTRRQITAEFAARGLLSTFDEVTLTYPSTGPRRATPDHDRTRVLSEAGGGTTLVDGIDIGVWKRKVVTGAVEVRVLPEVALSRPQVGAIEQAAARLGRFLELEPRLTLS